MPAITPDISRSFVEHVRLAGRRRARSRAAASRPGVSAPAAPPSRPGGHQRRPSAADAQALVVGSGLVVAADRVPARTRQDLVDCTLFAQLAANAAVPDAGDIGAWYRAYFHTLTAIGWAQSDTRLEDYECSGRNASAHQAILDVLALVLGPQAAAVAVAKAAIEALQAMAENRPWLTLFERESRTGKAARFQVTTAQVGRSGLVQAALVGFSLMARSTITQVLFLKFASSTATLRYAAGEATIYEAALAAGREGIAGRLAAYRAAYVGEVALPAPPGRRPHGGEVSLAPRPSRLTRALLS